MTSAAVTSAAGSPRWIVHRAFSTRSGGVSPAPWDSLNLGGRVGDDPDRVRRNRSAVAERFGVVPGAVQWLDQVHSATVALVDGPDPVSAVRSLPATDGVVTTLPGLALAVLAADCVPVLAADSEAGVIGAAHAGRPGAAAGILLELLRVMVGTGARVGAIDVLLGPAACGRCYEVPATMRDEVEAVLPGSATTTSWGTPALDLRAGLREQALAAGVAAVAVDARCTITDAELFSHRRATREGTTTGRQAGLVRLEPAG